MLYCKELFRLELVSFSTLYYGSTPAQLHRSICTIRKHPVVPARCVLFARMCVIESRLHCSMIRPQHESVLSTLVLNVASPKFEVQQLETRVATLTHAPENRSDLVE